MRTIFSDLKFLTKAKIYIVVFWALLNTTSILTAEAVHSLQNVGN
jgi:hypothetical protein